MRRRVPVKRLKFTDGLYHSLRKQLANDVYYTELSKSIRLGYYDMYALIDNFWSYLK